MAPSAFLASFKAHLASESVQLLVANWQKMEYGAAKAAACLHDGGPSSAVFGGDTLLFENVTDNASHHIRNNLTSVAYLPIRIFEVPIFKKILICFMSDQIKLNNDSVYSFRVSLVNLQMRYKIRRDLIDTANMAKNIIIEEVTDEERRPQRKRGRSQRGGFGGERGQRGGRGRGNDRGGQRGKSRR